MSQRRFQRVTIDAALAVLHCLTDQAEDGDALPPLVSEDISPGGLFLRTTKELPLGARVLLKLHLPSLVKPFTCVARVMRVEHRPNGGVRGVGLQFVQLTDDQQQQLVEHLYRSYQIQHDNG